jgi:hypothetical protein
VIVTIIPIDHGTILSFNRSRIDDLRPKVLAYRSIKDIIKKFMDNCGKNTKAKSFNLHKHLTDIAETKFPANGFI